MNHEDQLTRQCIHLALQNKALRRKVNSQRVELRRLNEKAYWYNRDLRFSERLSKIENTIKVARILSALLIIIIIFK